MKRVNFMINALHDVETTKKRGIYNYTPGYIMSYILALSLLDVMVFNDLGKKEYGDYH